MAVTLRLVSTDFDGTLIGHPSDGRCSPAFARELRAHKAAGGSWVINTGRSLAHALEGVEQFGAPVEPDFLICNERELFQRDAAGRWVDHGPWNEVCRARHRELFARAGGIFRRLRAFVAGTKDVTLIEADGVPEGLITSGEEVMEEVVGAIDGMRGELPTFSYQRNTIYLRFAHAAYHKGAALAELGRLLGVTREETFAVGDHHNDLSMLDGQAAAWVGCPANAIPEAKSLVRAAGGWVATESYGAGAAEALAWARKACSENEAAAA